MIVAKRNVHDIPGVDESLLNDFQAGTIHDSTPVCVKMTLSGVPPAADNARISCGLCSGSVTNIMKPPPPAPEILPPRAPFARPTEYNTSRCEFETDSAVAFLLSQD